MAITAQFTTYNGNPKKVNKNVTFAENPITVKAYETIDDLTCDFILNGHGYHGVNYMKVSWDGVEKFYFIEKRAGMTGDMTRITASCDVLYTYANEINNAPAVINRTSNNAYVNALLRDSKVLTLSGARVSSIRLSRYISDWEYYYVAVLQSAPSKISG